MEKVLKQLDVTLKDWEMMQKTLGDEGAEWAERFERNFYLFIDELKRWFYQLDHRPETVEEAEALEEIEAISSQLPGPIMINFLNELELIVEDKNQVRYD